MSDYLADYKSGTNNVRLVRVRLEKLCNQRRIKKYNPY